MNKLSPNPSRTEYMIISHKMQVKGANATTGLKLGIKEIKRVSNNKSLGVMVNEYLNWDDQLKSVKSKICGGPASLKKLKTFSLSLSYVVFIMLLLEVIFATQM